MKRGEIKIQYVSNLDGGHVPFSEFPRAELAEAFAEVRRLAHSGALRASWLLKRGKKVIARVPAVR